MCIEPILFNHSNDIDVTWCPKIKCNKTKFNEMTVFDDILHVEGVMKMDWVKWKNSDVYSTHQKIQIIVRRVKFERIKWKLNYHT